MGKLAIQEIAAVLVEKNGMEKREANQFAQAMFSLIQERLESDQTVKVKGLGTFKMISVEARESVSVRTGERVTISGHSKVTFTPDATMKELVNKPFSQFETVVLNDGVEFEDIKEETPVAEEEPAVAEEVLTVVGEVPAVVEEVPVAIAEEPAAVAEEPEEAPVAQPLMDVVEEQPDADAESPEEQFVPDEEEEPRPWGRWLLCALGVLALMALSAYGGYYFGTQQQAALQTVPDTVIVRDTVMVASVDTVTASANEPDAEPVRLEPEKTATQVEPVKAGPTKEKSVEAEPVKEKPVQSEPAAESLDKYAQKDARVRLGAYRIVGLDHEVKVLAGQTFYSICRANLGPDMECYVEVYNDLPSNPKIKEGQVIKIPKLQLKKRRK
ncbi:MAG: HU family DNA-binding protein [Prevotella sp.]|nr:HU family DNA-binding protein [Prevotella sp.]